MPPFAETAERRSRARRIGRALLVGVLAVSCLLGSALLLALGYSEDPRGQTQIAAWVAGALHARLPGLRLHALGVRGRDLVSGAIDVEDAEGRVAVHVDRVQMRPRWRSLLHGQVRLLDLQIEGLAIIERPMRDGRSNLATLAVARPDAAPAPPRAPEASLLPIAVRVDRVILRGGRVDARTADGRRVLVSQLDLIARGSSAGRRADVHVDQLSLTGDVDGRPIRVDLTGGVTLADDGRIDAVIERARIEGATPEGAVSVQAGIRGTPRGAQVFLAASGPRDAAARASGRVAWGPAGLSAYDLRASADRIEPDALIGGGPPGRLALRLAVRGSGLPLGPGSRAEVTAYVPPSSVAGHEIRGASLQGSSDGDRWTVARLEGDVAGAGLTASGGGRADEVHARVEASVRDPRAVATVFPRALAEATGRGRLVATVDGHLGGADHAGAALRFTARARASALRVSGLGTVEALALDLDGTAKATPAAAPARWTVAVRSHGDVARVTGRARELSLGHADWALDASASVPASPAAPIGDARFASTGRLRIGELAVGTGRVSSAEVALALRGSARAPVGRVAVGAHGVRLGDTVAAFDVDSAAALDGAGALSLHARASGPQAHAQIAAHGRMDAHTIEVAIDELAVDLRGPRLRQTIALRRPASIVMRDRASVHVSDLGLHAAGDGVAGELTLDATVNLIQPARDQPWARATVNVRRLTGAGIPPVDADAWVEVTTTRARAKVSARMGAAGLDLNVDAPVAPARTPAQLRLAPVGRVDVDVHTTQVALESLPPLQARLAAWGLTGGTFNVTATLRGDVADPVGRLSVDVRQLALRQVTGDGRDTVVHIIPGIGVSARVSTAADRIDLAGDALLYGAGVAHVNARLAMGPGALLGGRDPRAAPLTADVEIPRFQIAALRSFSDELRDTSGWLTGHGHVTGTLNRPTGGVDLALADGRIDRIVLASASAHAEADGRRLTATVEMRGARGDALTIRGQMALAGARAVDVAVSARHLDPGVARPFLDGVRELSGVVDADIRGVGIWPRLRLDGRIFFYGGRIGLVGQPTFHDVGLAIAIRPERIDLQKLQLYSGGGSIDGRGWVAMDGLRPTRCVLTAHANRFVVAAAGTTGTRLDGDLAVEVADRDDVWSGKVDVPRAAVWLPKLSIGGRHPQRVAVHDDVRFVDGASRAAAARRRGEARSPAAASTVDLHVQAGTIYVRAKDLDLELESAVTVSERVDEAGKTQPGLVGAVRIRRGRINIEGQRFEVEPGSITFDGSATNPRFDLSLTHAYTDAEITVRIQGTPAKPHLRMTSDPPIYDQAQIISLILTGQAQGPGAGGSGSIDPTATIATSVLTRVADKVAPQVGLDVVRFQKAAPTSDASASGGFAGRVEVGKYVSDRVYVSYAHQFGATDLQNANEAQAEYRLTTHWIAQTVFGDAGVGGLDTFWTYRY